MADASNETGNAKKQAEDQNALQGYFDWQVNTLMLAKDLVEPLARTDPWGQRKRREQTEAEVKAFSTAAIPDLYLNDPSLAWPPEVMAGITRATFDAVRDILSGEEAGG